MSRNETIHATSIAIDGHGLLIMGASGAGKSDLALRLIDRGALLISDDYTHISARAGQIILNAPVNIAGRMEIRHLGIVDMPMVADIPATLAIRLDDDPPRMPERVATIMLADIAVPLVVLAGREASAPIKAELALHHILREMGKR